MAPRTGRLFLALAVATGAGIAWPAAAELTRAVAETTLASDAPEELFASPDGRHVVVNDQLAFGCQHFWTTPEDDGEVQPTGAGSRLVAFDGRLDNREDLLRNLARSDLDLSTSSDARLVLEAFPRTHLGKIDRGKLKTMV